MATPAHRDLEQAVLRGSELLKQGKLDDAQKAFRAALILEPDNTKVLALLGLTYFRGGQFEQARPLYEDLVERAPTDASHRLNLGLVYLKVGDATRAIAALEASRALDPSQGRAVSYLGLAYARAGRYAEAYRAFLLAGQGDLATEIEANLTPAERDGIHSQLQRAGIEPVIGRTPTPPPKPAVSRTVTPAKGTPPIAPAPAPPPPPPAPARVAEAPPENARPRTLTPQHPPLIERPPAERKAPASVKSRTVTGEIGHKVEAKEEPPAPPPPPQAPDAASSDPEIRIEPERPTPVPAPAAHEISVPRMTDSLQFVLPTRDPVPGAVDAPLEGRSMISRAVAVATPASVAATTTALRVSAGATAPIPLSQLATDELVRPDDGDHPFEVTATGALVVRVRERVLTRLDGIHVTGGDLAYEPATRRSRGHQTEDRFDYGGTQLHTVTGNGYLLALPGTRTFTAVSLDDDIFYLREDLVFAFEASLRWENGNVPGLRGRLPVVQFRGDGAVAVRSEKPLVRVKLPAQGVVFVDAARLAGWIGRVIPRAVVPQVGGPMGDVCVECTGEGVVLVDPGGDPIMLARPSRQSIPPPPPRPRTTSAELLAQAQPEPPKDEPKPGDSAELALDEFRDEF